MYTAEQGSDHVPVAAVTSKCNIFRDEVPRARRNLRLLLRKRLRTGEGREGGGQPGKVLLMLWVATAMTPAIAAAAAAAAATATATASLAATSTANATTCA